MIALFGKKKLTNEQVANVFVNALIESVENGFPEVAGFVNDSPEFTHSPRIDEGDYGRFLMIVIAANTVEVTRHFQSGHDQEIIAFAMRKFARVFDMEVESFARMIKEYKAFINRVNHPSKNLVYGMSRAVFHKYELNEYQLEYYKKLNAPNPIFLKNLDRLIENFLWNWAAFEEKYKVVAE